MPRPDTIQSKQDNAHSNDHKPVSSCENSIFTQSSMSPQGKLAFLQGRLQQPAAAMVDTPELLQKSNRNLPIRGALQVLGNTLTAIVVAFFPKCPVCWAGYMSLFGAIGLHSIPYTPEVLFLFIAGMATSLYLHYKVSRRNHRMRPFILNLVGVAVVISGYFSGLTVLSYSGIVLLILSSLLINSGRFAFAGRSIKTLLNWHPTFGAKNK